MLNCIIATMGSNSGMKAASTPKLVHPPQRPFRVAVLQQQIEEDPLRFGVVAHLVVDQVQVRLDQAHGIGVDQHAGAQGLLEDPQHVELVLEELRARSSIADAVVNDDIALLDLWLAPEDALEQRIRLDVIGFQLGQEDAGQIADCGGVAEVVLHEDPRRRAGPSVSS